MDRDVYKYHACPSDLFSSRALGFEAFSDKKPFLKYINYIYGNVRGIKQYVYIMVNQTADGGFEVYFSGTYLNGELCKLTNTLAYSTKDVGVYSVDKGVSLYNNISESYKNFVIKNLFSDNAFGVVSKIRAGYHVVLLQLVYDDSVVTKDVVLSELRMIFQKYFIDDFGHSY